jgi:hypothetical protein
MFIYEKKKQKIQKKTPEQSLNEDRARQKNG